MELTTVRSIQKRSFHSVKLPVQPVDKRLRGKDVDFLVFATETMRGISDTRLARCLSRSDWFAVFANTFLAGLREITDKCKFPCQKYGISYTINCVTQTRTRPVMNRASGCFGIFLLPEAIPFSKYLWNCSWEEICIGSIDKSDKLACNGYLSLENRILIVYLYNEVKKLIKIGID